MSQTKVFLVGSLVALTLLAWPSAATNAENATDQTSSAETRRSHLQIAEEYKRLISEKLDLFREEIDLQRDLTRDRVPIEQIEQELEPIRERQRLIDEQLDSLGAELDAFSDAFEEAEPAFTRDEALTWFQEVAPVVERIAQRKLPDDLTIEVSDRAALAESIRADFSLQRELILESSGLNALRGLTDEQREVELTAAIDAEADLLAMAMLGKYTMTDGVLHLAPTNVVPLTRLYGIENLEHADLARAMLVHELVHALQDQETDLTATMTAIGADEDRAVALQSTIEGHAMVLTSLAAEELGITEAADALHRMLAMETVEGFETEMGYGRMVADHMTRVYRSGHAFMQAQWRSAEMANIDPIEHLWHVVANPPRSTEVIDTPELYGTESEAPAEAWADLDVVAEQALSRLGIDPGSQDVMVIRLNRVALSAAFAAVEDEQLRKNALDGFDDGRSFVAVDADALGEYDGLLSITASIVRFRTADDAREFLQASDEVARVSRELAASNGLEMLEFEEQSRKMPSGEKLRVAHAVLDVHGTTMRLSTARTVSGNRYVEIIANGGDATTNAAIAAAEATLAAWTEAAAD